MAEFSIEQHAVPLRSAQTTFRLYPAVYLGAGCIIGDFVIIGEPPQGADPGALATYIGPAATIRSHTVMYAGNTIGSRLSDRPRCAPPREQYHRRCRLRRQP